MSERMRYIFYLSIIVCMAILDQWTKWMIVTKMELYTSLSVVDDFFFITSHRNRGAAFGILQNQRFFLLIVTLFVVGILVYYLYRVRKGSRWLLFSISLILGGAVGNFIDRIRFGEVIDFLDFRFWGYHFPVFNVADTSLVIGGALLMILSAFYPHTIVNAHNHHKE